jgi:glycogen synthase
MINSVIKDVRAKHEGRIILHSHDWMAGGAITAYARSRGCPVLHTVHNVHTGHTPLDMYLGVDTERLSPFLYLSREKGRPCIDCQATAIKNASLINFVGEKFLQEIVKDDFLDRPIIPASIRREVKEKFYHGSTLSIINAPASGMFPEKCAHLVRKYGPDDEVLTAKTENLVAFQQRTGLIVNPQAILLYWPSRLDPAQKGIELLEDIALKFVIEHADVQIAVIGDGVGRKASLEGRKRARNGDPLAVPLQVAVSGERRVTGDLLRQAPRRRIELSGEPEGRKSRRGAKLEEPRETGERNRQRAAGVEFPQPPGNRG